MWNTKTFWWWCHLLVVVRCHEIRDFVAVNELDDGELETRVFFGGVTGKEVSVGRSSTSSLKFRQLADHSHLIQLIFGDDDELQDCEVINQKQQLKKFLHTFKTDLSTLLATSNVTVDSLDNKHLPQEIASWFNSTLLLSACKSLHYKFRQQALEMRSQRSKRSILIMPGTLWCGQSHNAKHYTQLGRMANTDRCCRRHDHCKRSIPGLSTKFGHHNYSPFVLSHCHCDDRQKRDVSDLLRVPGTRWCGKGFSAEKYTRLGGFSRTDKCCRRHDMSCPFWIGALETKYEYFNWRVNTIMHCDCDARFRACLKMVDSGDANLVGKLFFNVVQTKCFRIKPKKVCAKGTFWGHCEKYKHVKQAVIRDNPPF